jgi:hypothetical protein
MHTHNLLQAVPLQKLRERTFVASAKQVARHHASWLRSNRHLRYMWIPYTDSVVVVQVNPDGPPAKPHAPHQQQALTQQAQQQQQQQQGVGLSAYGDGVQEDAVDEQ